LARVFHRPQTGLKKFGYFPNLLFHDLEKDLLAQSTGQRLKGELTFQVKCLQACREQMGEDEEHGLGQFGSHPAEPEHANAFSGVKQWDEQYIPVQDCLVLGCMSNPLGLGWRGRKIEAGRGKIQHWADKIQKPVFLPDQMFRAEC
jgi:hypothetical protein